MKKSLLGRLARFAARPWPEKARRAMSRCLRAFPQISLPARLPFGAWWLARNDSCGQAILAGAFENHERQFVERFLRHGMTVLDIGAHHGYYTLLASKAVGSAGRVISFEPSHRECALLLRHLRLNGCANVTLVEAALGSSRGESELFVVDGVETGCNSLRPPNVCQPTKTFRVPVLALDEYLQQAEIERVDFIKLDAEGGELEILRGAARLLKQVLRPVVLVEVQDIRTQPWGYNAREIVSFLVERGFAWYRLLPGGSLEKMPDSEERYDGNFIAVPRELTTLGEANRSDTTPALVVLDG